MKMSEEETKEKAEDKEPTSDDAGKGDKPETPKTIVEANVAAKRLEDATAKHKEQLDRQEDMIARQILGGQADAGQVVEKPKKLTDTEYAEALERGEVNPLKEDGLIR